MLAISDSSLVAPPAPGGRPRAGPTDFQKRHPGPEHRRRPFPGCLGSGGAVRPLAARAPPPRSRGSLHATARGHPASQSRRGRAARAPMTSRAARACVRHLSPPAPRLTLDRVDERPVLMADLAAQAVVGLRLQARGVHHLVSGIRRLRVLQARALRGLPALGRGAAAGHGRQRGPRAGAGAGSIPVRVAAPAPALGPAAAAVPGHRANSPCNFGTAEVRARN